MTHRVITSAQFGYDAFRKKRLPLIRKLLYRAGCRVNFETIAEAVLRSEWVAETVKVRLGASSNASLTSKQLSMP